MKTDIDDGGSAFPCGDMYQGMSLRDYFAAQALVGWLATFSESDGHPCANGNDGGQFARASYRLADAMLKARNE